MAIVLTESDGAAPEVILGCYRVRIVAEQAFVRKVRVLLWSLVASIVTRSAELLRGRDQKGNCI